MLVNFNPASPAVLSLYIPSSPFIFALLTLLVVLIVWKFLMLLKRTFLV
jgi:hypothetical protein